jgi:hypothetical protein
MSVGPLNGMASVAGALLAQTKGTDVGHAPGEVGAQQRRVYHERKAAAAAGVGEPDGEDHEAADRDADGRRPWEDQPTDGQAARSRSGSPSKDPARERGNLLDLDG